MFEKVSRSLKYDSNIFSSTNIYMDTSPDHFTPFTLRVRGNKLSSGCGKVANNYNNLVKGFSMRQKLQNSKGYAESSEFLPEMGCGRLFGRGYFQPSSVLN